MKKARPVRGSEMKQLGEHLQRKVRKLQKQIAEAEWLIKELEVHQGKKSWSEYLRKRLDEYVYQTEGTKK